MTPETVRACAYLVADTIRQRRRYGQPIPPWLLALDSHLRIELSATGHIPTGHAQTGAPLKAANDIATENGCSARTIRRHAQTLGGRKVAGRWVFD